MATTTPQYHRDTGSPDQLPKGGAQELNTQPTTELAAGAAQEPVAEPGPGAPAPAGPMPQAVQPPAPFLPKTDEEKFLFGGTAHPNEDMGVGMTKEGMVMPPPEVYDALPALGQAAADPAAPPQLKMMYAYLVNALP